MRISDWSSDVCSSDLVVGGTVTYRAHAANGALGGVTAVRSARRSSQDTPSPRRSRFDERSLEHTGGRVLHVAGGGEERERPRQGQLDQVLHGVGRWR